MLTACNNPVFFYEGDCEVSYYLRFVYDMNLKWADAFPSEVKSYNLYVFDNEGKFVKEYSENGAALEDPAYTLKLDLMPGEYQLVAWCGLDNAAGAGESFLVPEPIKGQTTIEELSCKLRTLSDASFPVYSDTQLKFLYHGNMSVNLPDTQDGQDYYYTMYLTKDTNHIRIILQDTGGDNIEVGDFMVTIESDDSWLAYDNLPIASAPVTYLPWSQVNDEMGFGDDDSDIKYSYGLVADLSMSRIMAEQQNTSFLTIRNAQDHEIIARVPFIQYALLIKEYYEEAYGHAMTPQEFLDREDEYELTFFMIGQKWIDSYIYINSWRVVLHNYDVGS